MDEWVLLSDEEEQAFITTINNYTSYINNNKQKMVSELFGNGCLLTDLSKNIEQDKPIKVLSLVSTIKTVRDNLNNLLDEIEGVESVDEEI